MVSGSGFRPAVRVNPKAFFAPGRTSWSPQEQITAYGTPEKLSVDLGMLDQGSYAAIVLVNPLPDAAPLELSATVVRDRPRRVNLVDSDGKPVVGAVASGTASPWWPLRGASLTLTGVGSDRVSRYTFVHRDRRLVGSLTARADGDAPYTVRMQPWAVVTGRLVGAKGEPSAAESNSIRPPRPTPIPKWATTRISRAASADDSGLTSWFPASAIRRGSILEEAFRIARPAGHLRTSFSTPARFAIWALFKSSPRAMQNLRANRESE